MIALELGKPRVWALGIKGTGLSLRQGGLLESFVFVEPDL